MELKDISGIPNDEIACSHATNLPSDLPQGYRDLLSQRNGGTCQDGYWHFFGPSGPDKHNVFIWNKSDLWKGYYGLDDSKFVFAEDLFGNQYFFKRGSRGNAVYALWTHDGSTNFMADTFFDFIEDVVDDDEAVSDFKKLAARFFRKTFQKVRPFHHLTHQIPMILGGKDEPDNLEFSDSLSNLVFTGQLISQLKDVPAGTKIKDVIIDREKREVRLIL